MRSSRTSWAQWVRRVRAVVGIPLLTAAVGIQAHPEEPHSHRITVVATLGPHTDGAERAFAAGDPRYMLTADGDKTIVRWEIGSERRVQSLKTECLCARTITVDPEGRLAAVATADFHLMVYNLDSMNHRYLWRWQPRAGNRRDPVVGAHFLSARDLLVGSRVVYQVDISTRAVLHKFPVYFEGRVAVTQDRKRIVLLDGWAAGTARSFPEFKEIEYDGIRTGWASSSAIRADGKMLAFTTPDEGLLLMDISESARPQKRVPLRVRMTAAALSSEEDVLLLGDERGAVYVLDYDGKILCTEAAHTDEIREITVLPGSRFATASRDGNVRIWNLESPLK